MHMRYLALVSSVVLILCSACGSERASTAPLCDLANPSQSRRLVMTSFESGWYVDRTTLYNWHDKIWQPVATTPLPLEAHAIVWTSLSYLRDDAIWLSGFLPVLPSGHPTAILARWDGRTITIIAQESPTSDVVDTSFTGVAALADNNVWLIGQQQLIDGGAHTAALIRHWNGATLRALVLGDTQRQLNAISMVGADDGWIVGEHGLLLRYRAGQWQATASPTTTTLTAISMVSATQGIVVGQSMQAFTWNGTRWQGLHDAPVLADTTLVSVSACSNGEMWMVGYPPQDTRVQQPVLLKWDGDMWSQEGISNPPNRQDDPALLATSAVNGYTIWVMPNGAQFGDDKD